MAVEALVLPWSDEPSGGIAFQSSGAVRRLVITADGLSYADAELGIERRLGWKEFVELDLSLPTLPRRLMTVVRVLEAIAPQGFPVNGGEEVVLVWRDPGVWLIDEFSLAPMSRHWFRRSVVEGFSSVSRELSKLGRPELLGTTDVATAAMSATRTMLPAPRWFVRRRVSRFVREFVNTLPDARGSF